jgi:outer membrane protein assembly factor BamB
MGSSADFVGNGLLVRGRTVRLIGPSTGRVVWQRPDLSPSGLTRGTTAIFQRRPFVAVDARTGKRLWRRPEPGAEILGAPTSGTHVFETRDASAV